MNYIISSYSMYHLPIEKAVKILLEEGWSCIEVMCEGHGYEMLSWDNYKLLQLRSLLIEYGAKINFHGPFKNFNPAEKVNVLEINEIWKKCLELVSYFDSDYILFHPGRAENKQDGLECIHDFYYKRMSDVPKNALLLFENVPPYENQIGSTSNDLIEILSTLQNSKRLGVCFDTGHAFLSVGERFNQELQDLNPFIKAFHLNDNHGLKDEHLAIGEGDIPFEEVFKLIGKNKFFVNFEMKTVEYANQSLRKLQSKK